MGKGLSRYLRAMATMKALMGKTDPLTATKVMFNFHARKLIGWEPFDVPELSHYGLPTPF